MTTSAPVSSPALAPATPVAPAAPVAPVAPVGNSPDPLRAVMTTAWSHLPRLLALDAFAAVTAALVAGLALVTPLLAVPVAALVGGPVAAALCVAGARLLNGDPPRLRDVPALVWRCRGAGRRTALPVAVASSLLGITLLARDAMPASLAWPALLLNAAFTGTAVVAAVPALPLAATRDLKGGVLWRTALACVAASPATVLGTLALLALGGAALPLMGPLPLLLLPAFAALLTTAVTDHVSVSRLGLRPVVATGSPGPSPRERNP